MRSKRELKERLIEIIEDRKIQRCDLLFSGGLDSAILAKMLLDLRIEFEAYVAGFEGCYDIDNASRVAEELGISITIVEMDRDIKGIQEVYSNSDFEHDKFILSLNLPVYFCLKRCEAELVMSGRGADELFCGYKKYGRFPDSMLIQVLDEDISKVLQAVDDELVARYFSKELFKPFLSLVDLARNLPLEMRREKFILKELAKDLGLSGWVSEQPKKAIQYGSGSDKFIRKFL